VPLRPSPAACVARRS